MKKNNLLQYESIEISLDPIKQPIAYKNRVESLILSGLSQEEAELEALEPIDMEFYYDINNGLFMVEEGAVESIDITNPYTGELLEEFEEFDEDDEQ